MPTSRAIRGKCLLDFPTSSGTELRSAIETQRLE
jgi:hypothetical protein